MITVGIAVHNEEKTIQKVISIWQNEPIDEILIISSSTDKTNEIIKKMAEKDRRINLLIEPEKKGKPNSINRILEIAKNDIIIMTDGDVFIESGSTKQLIQHLNSGNKKIGIVAGRGLNINPKGMFGLWDQMLSDIYHKKRINNFELDLSGCLYAIRKGIIKTIPVNTTLDDAYVAFETKKAGYDIIYEPNAVCWVKGVETLSDFINQRTRRRVGWYQLRYREKAKTSRTWIGEMQYVPKTLNYLITPEGIIAVPLYYLLNTLTWIYAWWLWKTEKNCQKIWKPISSTKNMK